MDSGTVSRRATSPAFLLICLALGACQTLRLTDTPPAPQAAVSTRPAAPTHLPAKTPRSPASSTTAGRPAGAIETGPTKSASLAIERPEKRVPKTVDSKPARSKPKARDGARGTIKVGLLLPLSGPRERLGRELLDAAQLALFELADGTFELLPVDTKGTAAGAAAAAETVLARGAKLILGPVLATSAKAVGPVARRAGVSVVAFSNSRGVAGNGVFILGLVPSQQVHAVVDYAVSEGIFRFAALAPNDAYGRTVIDAFRRAARAREAEVVRVQFYDPAATDFSGPAKIIADYNRRRRALLEQRAKLEARDDEASRQALERLEKLDTIGEVDFGAVLLPARGQQLKALASLLAYYDVDRPAVRLLGLSNWGETDKIATEPSLAKGWCAAPPRQEREKFSQRFKSAFGRPPAAIAALAYDATALAVILSQPKSPNDFSPARLTQPFGFLGVDGLFRLRPVGVAERVFEIREVRREGFTTLRPAPNVFPGAGS